MTKKKDIKLSAAVVIRNEGPYLVQFFNHLKMFCDEIIVVDQQSTDNSLRCAATFADKVFVSPNVGWNELDKWFAVSQADNDWVVILDPDERFPKETIEQLPEAVDRAIKKGAEGVRFKVRTFWDGYFLKHGEIEQIRIIKKGTPAPNRIHTNFNPKSVIDAPLIQLHIKDFGKHKVRLKKRQKLKYAPEEEEDDRIKRNENDFVAEINDKLTEEKRNWVPVRKSIIKKVKECGEYVFVTKKKNDDS